MKTFTPIAMRCTEEQFKAIESKLRKNITSISKDWDLCYYLTNNWMGDYMRVTNVCKEHALQQKYTDKLYHEWNEEIFLNACGIEPTYTITKEQLTYLHSVENIKETIEEWFPNEFLKPIEVTLEEIAKLKGVDVSLIKIIK